MSEFEDRLSLMFHEYMLEQHPQLDNGNADISNMVLDYCEDVASEAVGDLRMFDADGMIEDYKEELKSPGSGEE